MSEKEYEYSFDPTSKKFECPECKRKSWVRIIDKDGNYIDEQYGKCDKKNSCDHSKYPNDGIKARIDSNAGKVQVNLPFALPNGQAHESLKVLSSPFHQFCRENFQVTDEFFEKWLVGTSYGNRTSFGIHNGQVLLNCKLVLYKLDGCRDRNSYPIYLKAPEGYKYSKCLYGLHLVDGTKPIVLVESEKTAFIAALHYPEYDFVSSGGSSGIKSKDLDQILEYDVPIIYVADNDNAGKNNSIRTYLSKLSKKRGKIIIKDTPETWEEGNDIADFIIENPGQNVFREIGLEYDEKGKLDSSKYDKEYPFIQKRSKGKGDHKVTFYVVDEPLFIDWLSTELGFAMYRAGDEYYYVKITDNVLSTFQRHELKNYVSEYLKKSPEVRHMVMRRKGVMSEENLHYLKDVTDNVKIARDKKDSSCFYFKSSYYKVTKDKIEGPILYKDMKHYIWDTDIIDRDIEIDNDCVEFEFNKFLLNVTSDDQKRYTALLATIGYILHTYKDRSNSKCIVFCDEYSTVDEANGGTGKTLIIQAIEKSRCTTKEDGKMFTPRNNRFIYQKVTPETKVFVIDDISSTFKWDTLFSIITGSMTVEKKNQTAIEIQFEDSPKIVITTNHHRKSNDESHNRRFVDVELSNHYSSKYSPIDEFGRRFFDDWSKEDWNQFYTLMMMAVQKYFEKGLKGYETASLALNKLAASTSLQFVQYAESAFELGVKYLKKETHKDFLECYPDYKKLSQKKLTSWLKTWAKYQDCQYVEKGTKGNKDRQFKFIPFEIDTNTAFDDQDSTEEIPF